MCALCGYNRVGNENEPEQTLGPLLLSVKEGNDMGVGKRGACTPDQVRSAEKGKQLLITDLLRRWVLGCVTSRPRSISSSSLNNGSVSLSTLV